MSEQIKCQMCGQCCRKLIIDDISDIDLMREPKIKPYIEEFITEDGRYLLKTPCPFLIVNPGGINHNKCSIYPTRPNICVAFEPGDKEFCKAKQGS